MAKLKSDLWTLVQHSAYGYQEKPGWEHAVETRRITTDVELKRVESVGGYVFTSYNEADEQEYKSNYPADHPTHTANELMYPHVKGTFSHKELDGLKIYMPATVQMVIG